MVGRRRFLALALGAALLPSVASAAIKMPTKAPPARVRPLGRWSIKNSRPETLPGEDIDIELTFKSDLDVSEPYINFWPRGLPMSPLPVPVPPGPNTPYVPPPLPGDRRPPEMLLGDLPGNDPEIFTGVVTPITLPITVASNAVPGRYLITVQLSDGAFDDTTKTRRRAIFTVLLRVKQFAGLPTPTPPPSAPRPTKTPKLPVPQPTWWCRPTYPFCPPTPTPTP